MNEIQQDQIIFVLRWKNEDVLWFIPMSSRVEKYKAIMENKIKLYNKYVVNEEDKLTYLNDRYEVTKFDNYLKIYIPEVIPKYKNVNNYAYKNIMLNVMEKTKEYKDLYKAELVFVFIKVVENQKNIDIGNKFVKPIIDGLVLSKVGERIGKESKF
ncbi:MAG: hypothetical protein ACLS90_04075 [Clostridia bacterium]